MATVLAELAAEPGTEAAEPHDALGTLAPALADVFGGPRGALAKAHRRGWRLVAPSNSDRDPIDASPRAIGVPLPAPSCPPRSLLQAGPPPPASVL